MMLANTEFSAWKSIPAGFQRNKMVKLRERETGSSMSNSDKVFPKLSPPWSCFDKLMNTLS